jgi:hypothetical protein
VALPTTSRTSDEAKQLLQLEKDEVAKIRRQIRHDHKITAEMINNTDLHKMLVRARDTAPAHISRSVDAVVTSGLFMLTPWSKARLVKVEELEFYADEKKRVVARLEKYGCVIPLAQTEIAKQIHIPLSTLERGIAFLKHANVIVATEAEAIYLNPFIVWRGDNEHRMATIRALIDDNYLVPPTTKSDAE